ncbi:amino acid ABC transporter permease [Jatrophihabitans cynanchi]|jgi:polar amino acid transport system permease protein|uniref:Amino acid ABC transporter permease n=1 Tax=Jatrophihabitans cynanchi TaxID=2944128 RepID=A0ABY7K293_9ACTN|nr:amino acid ABC transporter permease [Jatrophihabitans sp. SB3-54]WAX58961.1 amino acid ABC transporter permease [Jatrophihabitans sp. SB3-54]
MSDTTTKRRSFVDRLTSSRNPVHIIWSVLILIIVVATINSVARNKGFEWGTVGDYFFSSPILHGLVRTLELTALGALVGFVGGTILAVMRLSGGAIASGVSQLYVWFFRGTPLLVQIIFWFNLGALYRTISFGVPWGPTFWHADSNSLITPFTAAILGLGLNAAAYMSEIVRAGIQSIHHGQSEAAYALGLTKVQTLFSILLPQAMRLIVPPASNEVISMLKYSSLVSVIAVPELLYSAQIIYSRTFETIPLLVVASLWYLIVTTVLTIAQHFIEKHFAKGIRVNARARSRTADPNSGVAIEPGAEPLTFAGTGDMR